MPCASALRESWRCAWEEFASRGSMLAPCKPCVAERNERASGSLNPAIRDPCTTQLAQPAQVNACKPRTKTSLSTAGEPETQHSHPRPPRGDQCEKACSDHASHHVREPKTERRRSQREEQEMENKTRRVASPLDSCNGHKTMNPTPPRPAAAAPRAKMLRLSQNGYG